jgi:hypothetical protein
MSVREIQARLKELGFDPGEVDGKSGARTVKAIKAFQVANGLSADGKVGQLTWGALFGEAMPARTDPVLVPAAPSASAGPWPLQKDCMTFYGGVGLHQKRLALPYPMKLAWDRRTSISSILVHEKVHDSAGRCFAKIAATFNVGDRKELGIDIFSGGLNVRKMRGGSSYSMHSWGIAIDFDDTRNQLKWDHTKARLARPDAIPFWEIWEAEGWVSLGRARDFDWMHVQAARLV